MSREQKREAVRVATAVGLSERRACRLVMFARSVFRHRPTRRTGDPIVERLVALAHKYPQFGYRQLWRKLRRDVLVNHKKVYRLYCFLRLKLRRRSPKKRRSNGSQNPMIVPARPNERWSMDFTADSLAGGRRFRTLNVIDDCTRECPAIEVDTSLPAVRVVRVLERIATERGYPKQIVVDNGPEFDSNALRQWAAVHRVDLHFIEKGKPQQNAYVESFNGKFRFECLSREWFSDLAEARRIIEEWRVGYNTDRPHSSIGGIPPAEYALKLEAA